MKKIILEADMKANIYTAKRYGKRYLQISVVDGKDNTGKLNRKVITTDIVVEKKYWDNKKKEIKKRHPRCYELNREYKEKLEFVESFIFENRTNTNLIVALFECKPPILLRHFLARFFISNYLGDIYPIVECSLLVL